MGSLETFVRRGIVVGHLSVVSAGGRRSVLSEPRQDRVKGVVAARYGRGRMGSRLDVVKRMRSWLKVVGRRMWMSLVRVRRFTAGPHQYTLVYFSGEV